MIKYLITKFSGKLFYFPYFYKFLRWLFLSVSNERQRYYSTKITPTLKEILHKPEVQSGPFKGINYPSYISFGSKLYPKLFGTYESELHAIIEKTSYDQI